MKTPTNSIRDAWDRLFRLPGGRYLFSRTISRLVPYMGTIRPFVEDLSPGHGQLRMQDRRAVRNHLDSVHAVALMNLAEATTGLSLTYSLPPGGRIILLGLSMDYLKKARGTLTAECRFDPPAAGERQEFPIEVDVRDAQGNLVARGTARWLVGPGG